MSNWKASGSAHVQGFQFKKATKSTSQTQTTSIRVCKCWTSTYLDDKRMHITYHERQEQRNSCSYIPIAFLPLVWKRLTSIFSEAMYRYLSCQELLPKEKKGCRTNSRGIKYQLLIDKAILKNCRRRLNTNLSMA